MAILQSVEDTSTEKTIVLLKQIFYWLGTQNEMKTKLRVQRPRSYFESEVGGCGGCGWGGGGGLTSIQSVCVGGGGG